MRDLAAKDHISRYHAGFLDPEGQYEIVSSLSKKAIRYEDIHKPANEQEEKGTQLKRDTFPAAAAANDDDYLFYMKALWSLVALSILVWICYRWVAPPKTRNDKTRESTMEENSRSCSAETSAAGHRVQNLCSQFDEVKDYESKVYKWSDELTKSPVVDRLRQYECVETTSFTREASSNLMTPGGESSDSGQELLGKQPSQLLRHCQRHRQPQMTPPRARSRSPPSLVDEPCEDRPRTVSPEPRMDQVSTTPTMQPMPLEKEQTNQLGFEASMEVIVQHSYACATPQKMAQEFCQNVEIIEQELARSNRKEDSSRIAANLAMLHQSSQIRDRQLQREISYQTRRQSSITLEKYDDILKEVSLKRNKCLCMIWSAAINYSPWVCVLLEGGRYGSRLLNDLEYFSMQNLMEALFQMACGCEEDSEWDDGVKVDTTPQSTLFLQSFLPSWEGFGMDNGVLSNVLSAANRVPCVLGYVSALVLLLTLHATLRYMHFLDFLHQLVNLAWLLMSLAQHPRVWVVVTDNLDRYSKVLIADIAITLLCFISAIWYVHRIQNYISERQDSIREAKDSSAMTPCQARRMIQRFEDTAMFTYSGPVVVGMILLCM